MRRIDIVGIVTAFLILASMAARYQAAAAEPPTCAKACGAGCGERTLDPPRLPTVPSGKWQSERAVFPMALYVEDENQAFVGKPLDMSGVRHLVAFDYWRSTADTGQEAMEALLARYADALSCQEFKAVHVRIPGEPYYLTATSADGPYGSDYGQLKIAQGKLRFVATSYQLDDDGEDAESDADAARPAPKKIHVSGTIEIFVSDETPVQDLVARIAAATSAGGR